MRIFLVLAVVSAAVLAWESPAHADDDDECEVDVAPPVPLPTPQDFVVCRSDLRPDGVDCWPDSPAGSPRPDAPPLRGAGEWATITRPQFPMPDLAVAPRADVAERALDPGHARGIERPPR